MKKLLIRFFNHDESYRSFCERIGICYPLLLDDCEREQKHFMNCDTCQQGWVLFYTVQKYIRDRSDNMILLDFFKYKIFHRHQSIHRAGRRLHQWYVRHVKNRKIPNNAYLYFNMKLRQETKERLTQKQVSQKFNSLSHSELNQLNAMFEHYKLFPTIIHDSEVIKKYIQHYKELEKMY